MTDYDKRDDMLVHEEVPFNAEPPRAALADAALTPVDTFSVRGHGPVCEIDPGLWTVQVQGLVRQGLSLGFDDLQGGRFGRADVVATLQCAGNRRSGLIEVRDIPGEAPWGPGATGTAQWRGVPLREILSQAGPLSEATDVAFIGADLSEEAEPPQLYGASIPLEKALGEEVLLAYEMNGQPLAPVHGGPVRVVVPGYIGARSVKWLQGIELRQEPWSGYFQETSYRLLAPGQEPGPGEGMALGEVALNADFLYPDDGATVGAGTVEVGGYAFAGGTRSVSRVDISPDGGQTWSQAELLEDQGRWAWRLWRATLNLPAGQHELVARAWDSAGNLQPERPESVWNTKGYVNNSWARIRINVQAWTPTRVHKTDRAESVPAYPRRAEAGRRSLRNNAMQQDGQPRAKPAFLIREVPRPVRQRSGCAQRTGVADSSGRPMPMRRSRGDEQGHTQRAGCVPLSLRHRYADTAQRVGCTGPEAWSARVRQRRCVRFLARRAQSSIKPRTAVDKKRACLTEVALLCNPIASVVTASLCL